LATGALCQTKFEEYYNTVKEFFGGTPSETAIAQAELSKSRGGGYDENSLNKGPQVAVNTSLNFGSFLPKSCPQAKQIYLLGGAQFGMPFDDLCNIASLIGYALVAGCSLMCARYIMGAA
jgi:hypothetical protein